MSKLISPTFIKNVKQSAKKLKKELSINHTKALELASKEAGFSSYHALQKTFSNTNTSERNYVQDIRNYLIKIIESEHCTSVIKDHEVSLLKYHDIEDIKPKVMDTILDAFDNGIKHDGQNANADLVLLKSGFYNEAIKDLGYSIIEKDGIDKKIQGNLLVALGHFFRSVHDCFSSQRFIHPSFEIYLADWLRALKINESHVSTTMHELFVANEYSGLPNGTTYWKPFNNKSN
ncbi:MAG: hypothetical protein ACI9YE_001180 [Psychroserpens sp.]|jgi:hypothetical protein